METQDQTTQLAALLAQMQAAGTITQAPSAWAKPAPVSAPAGAECLGISVPITVETPVGKVRLYLNFPGSHAASTQTIMALLEHLAGLGYPLDAWQPKPQGNNWGGGNRGGYNRGGYNADRGNNNGGGWGGR